MYGVITTRHLVLKAPIIIQEFGLKTYCRCLFRTFTTRRHVTFLECVLDNTPHRTFIAEAGDAHRISSESLAGEELLG
jgi:hypothetical protein